MRHQANELAHREGISLNHFVSLAIAEKIIRMEQSMFAQPKAKQVGFGSTRLIPLGKH
jgi:hypothetical protein